METLHDPVAKAKIGDTAAYKHIFDLLHDRIFAYALSHTRNREEAKDLLQETFIDFWKALPRFSYESDEALLGFMFRILKRKIARYYDEKKKLLVVDDEALVDLAGSEDQEHEDYRFLERHIARLSHVYQEVLRLRYWSALSYREIAVILDTKEATAKVWHHRAVEELRKLTSQNQREIYGR